jgi:hypothetical protein
MVDDEAFLDYVAGHLGQLPGVAAVTLGGSRAEGTHRPDSDWDFSIYYRGHFDPQTLRDIGWPGEVFDCARSTNSSPPPGPTQAHCATSSARPTPLARTPCAVRRWDHRKPDGISAVICGSEPRSWEIRGFHRF